MIEQLIERTNNKKFFGYGRLHLTELKGQIGYINTMEYNFVVDEEDSAGNLVNVEYWRLISHQTLKFSGIYSVSYLPYIKLKVLTDHPLLWKFNKSELVCEINGNPSNPSEFIGDFLHAYELCTGNWIPIQKTFFSIRRYFKERGKLTFNIPEPLADPIRLVCEKHQIEFNIEKVIKGHNKGYTNRPNVKLLLFGNEDVCSNDFDFGQPYIIADEFIAKRK